MALFTCQYDENFKMKSRNIPKAWKALKLLFAPNSEASRQYISAQPIYKASSFSEAMAEAGWIIYQDIDENVESIKLLDEGCIIYADLVFGRIAPFVEDDSYIIMEDSDRNFWRWKFKNGQLIKSVGRLVFDDKPEGI